MSAPVWSEKEGRWTLRIYEGRKCVKKFTSTKKGKAGRNEVLRKRTEYEAGTDTHASVGYEWGRFLVDVSARYCPEAARNIEVIGNNNILPACRVRLVSQMSVNEWQTIINSARKKNGEQYSKRYYKTLRATIGSFLKFCERDGLQVANSSLLYTPRHAPTKEKAVISTEVARRLFDDREPCAQDYFIHFYRVLYLCGLRPSEACGLKWSDIQEGKRLVIRRAVTRTMRISEGKTQNAQRTQYLPQLAVRELEAQRELTKSLKSEWVFPNFSGGVLCQDLPAKHWVKIRAALGCPDIALYNFRHTYITNLAAAGVPLISLKSLCGHSLEFKSLEHYGHTTDEALQAAQIQLDNLFNGTIKGS